MAFDDFERERETERLKRERVAKERKGEWEILKGFVSQFALDGKTFDGNRFAWTTDLTGNPMLVLNFVSATLCGDESIGGKWRYSVIFSRKPAGSGAAYPDDSPIPSKEWELTGDIVNDGFVWCVNRDRGRAATDIADAVAETLARYHVEYEQAYGRAS